MTTPFQLPENFDPQSGEQQLGQARANFAYDRAASTSQPASEAWAPPQSFGAKAKDFGKSMWSGYQGASGSGLSGDPNAPVTVGHLNEAMAKFGGQVGGQASSGDTQNAGGVMDRNVAFFQGHSGGPQASGTQQPNAPSPLTADFAAQRLNMQAYQQNVHDSIESGRASFRQRSANYAGTSPQGLSPSLSGNAMSASQGANTMNGLVGAGNGNGMSESTYQNKKWGQQ